MNSKLVQPSANRILKGAPIKRDSRNVCIFCGSNSGNDPGFIQEAKKLAQVLASQNYGIVYGGASVGIMGAVADAMLEAGGRVSGVIPQTLVDREVAHRRLTDLRIVPTMHERKKIMFDLSDAFISLPGGFGTLDETFEIITWKQIGIHDKPLVLFNYNGFYAPVIDFVDKAVSAGLIKDAHRKLFSIAKTVDEILQFLPKH
jgi:uncharacterized protein (TIGR00730 family)